MSSEEGEGGRGKKRESKLTASAAAAFSRIVGTRVCAIARCCPRDNRAIDARRGRRVCFSSSSSSVAR